MIKLIDAEEKFLDEYKEAYLMSLKKIEEGLIKKHDLMFMNPDDAKISFKTVSPIDITVQMPDPEMFNVNAINPTVEVYIGKCVDADQDGVLSDAEKVACNEIDTK